MPKEEIHFSGDDYQPPLEKNNSPVFNEALETAMLLDRRFGGLSGSIIGLNDIIRQAFYAILTGEHMLILSRTGMAKSYLASSIFNLFDRARTFSAQASKDQTPDNYFGPYSIDDLRKGVMRHNIAGSIVEAHLVFLDELFDTSDMVLRSLLSVLNERRFMNGPEEVVCAVHSAIATANYMRLNDVTEAVLDRFIFKSLIPEKPDLYGRLLIDHTYETFHGRPPVPGEKISFDRIIRAAGLINNTGGDASIRVPDLVYFIKNAVLNRYAGRMRKRDGNFTVSPRKGAKLAGLLRASALGSGRLEAALDDIRELHYGACTLNSVYDEKSGGRSEKDLFLESFDEVMLHMNSTGAMDQIRFLLDARRVFLDLRKDPEKTRESMKKKGVFQGIKDLLLRLFPAGKGHDGEITIDVLKRHILDISPATEEVRDLKDGILRDFRDVR